MMNEKAYHDHELEMYWPLIIGIKKDEIRKMISIEEGGMENTLPFNWEWNESKPHNEIRFMN